MVPTPEQMGASWGSAVDVWQRLGAAAFLTLITAKLNMILVASGSATYPFWGPVLNAANRNRALRKSGRLDFPTHFPAMQQCPHEARYTSANLKRSGLLIGRFLCFCPFRAPE